MSRLTLISGLVAIAIVQGCSATDQLNAPSAAHEIRSSAVGTPDGDAQYLARGIALALNDPAPRAHIRNAMRDSRWTDHKLDLHAYLKSREGQELLTLAALRLGAPRSVLVAIVAGLPAMDFYVPFTDHRLAWKGSPEVMVAASFEPDAATLRAFQTDGSVAALQLADGTPRRTLIILHPAEPRGVLETTESPHGGETIQRESEPGIAMLPCNAEPYRSVSVSDACETDPGPGSGGGTPMTPGVYLTTFYSFRGDGWWGSVEMEFRSHGFSGIPTYEPAGFWLIPYTCSKGVVGKTFEPHRQYSTESLLVSPGVTNVSSVLCPATATSPHGFAGYYYVSVIEFDGGLNGGNDDFGLRFFIGGTTPFGALIGREELYYSRGGYPADPNVPDNTGAGELSVALTLRYR